jgi:putative polyketide hydroxylase
LGVDLEFHRIGTGGISDPQSLFPVAYGIPPEGAVLIRPDGFVAWRAQHPQEFSSVVASLLHPKS